MTTALPPPGAARLGTNPRDEVKEEPRQAELGWGWSPAGKGLRWAASARRAPTPPGRARVVLKGQRRWPGRPGGPISHLPPSISASHLPLPHLPSVLHLSSASIPPLPPSLTRFPSPRISSLPHLLSASPSLLAPHLSLLPISPWFSLSPRPPSPLAQCRVTVAVAVAVTTGRGCSVSSSANLPSASGCLPCSPAGPGGGLLALQSLNCLARSLISAPGAPSISPLPPVGRVRAGDAPKAGELSQHRRSPADPGAIPAAPALRLRRAGKK
ncbi:uncharacterized protein LOC127482038 [Manacus candei]|uniref:uncharacterized protein LOC127482038 n=1 Tax=Manacus candei TaxID=415023 RepID=UPI002227C30B|nr:uncharacterized protein LOC127482038 [Manacus candei]